MMYVTGTNCNGEFIILLNRDEFNNLLRHLRDDAFHDGLMESRRIDEECINDDI